MIHVLDPHEGHLAEHVAGDILQVLLVLLGQDELADALAMRGQDLLAQAAYRQDPTPQRDLAGHAHLA